MGSSSKTPFLDLSQFSADNKPDWLTDYNSDMLKISTSFGSISSTAEIAATNAQTAITNSQTAINTSNLVSQNLSNMKVQTHGKFSNINTSIWVQHECFYKAIPQLGLVSIYGYINGPVTTPKRTPFINFSEIRGFTVPVYAREIYNAGVIYNDTHIIGNCFFQASPNTSTPTILCWNYMGNLNATNNATTNFNVVFFTDYNP